MFKLIENIEREMHMEEKRLQYMEELRSKDDAFFIEKMDQFKSFYKLFNQKREK